jgi:chemotaxis protein MotB
MARSHDELEEAGEGYFASVSDLMIGILFIFLLMLAVFAINYADQNKDEEIARLREQVKERDKKILDLEGQISRLIDERNKLRDGILELINQLEGVTLALRGDQGRLEEVRRGLLFALRDALKKRDVDVVVDERAGILRLSSKGLFKLNSDVFTDEGEEKARKLLEEMAKLLPCFAKAASGAADCREQQPIFETVLIEGHTDTQDTARPGGNWTLSTDRARAFHEYMTVRFPPLRELRNQDNQHLLGLAGYGDSRPLPNVDGADESNRRIEIRFLLTGQRDVSAQRLQQLDQSRANARKLVESIQ